MSNPSALLGPQYGQPSFGHPHLGMPVDYGSTLDQTSWGAQGLEKRWASAQDSKPSFARHARRRLNITPVVLCVVLPWLLFSAVLVVNTFAVHYEQPALVTAVVWGGFCIVLATTGIALSMSKWFGNGDREPSWYVFLAVTMLLAWLMAVMLGSSNYETNMRPYFDMMNLNNYSNVSPAQMRGQQLMDAGSITFAAGTKLDLSKSMGFKSTDVYCVAPITIGDVPLATYDFWAVGTNCCSGNLANFHCEGFNDPRANGGLRLMNDGARAYYRLAVQQAEAAYNIRSVHPLFFQWMPEPMKAVEAWWEAGKTECIMWVTCHFLLQVFLVAVAAFGFSKLGS